MKNNMVLLSLVAVLTLMAGFGFAGTGVTMRVSVPFDFYAGNQQLPAGEYTIEMGSGFLPTASIMTVRADQGTGIWIIATKAGTDRDLDSCTLLFNKYGDKHFLSTVSIRGYKAGLKELKLEKELRAKAEVEQNTVIIAQK
jgi:hypothetical protein